ncbi:MAG: hypothetical protein ACR2FH_05995 [Caulobacteraceae bacterium]
MKGKLLSGMLLMSSALAVGALAPSAASALGLNPGNYSINGQQNICLKADGTWFGETFSGWGGQWKLTGLREDATVIYGNYASGVGNDTMVVTQNRNVDWTEWRDDLSFSNFVDGTVTKIHGHCTGPAAALPANSARHNPMD